MGTIIVTKHVGPGMVLIESEYGQQLWTTVKVRKHKRCFISGVDLYKKEAYSPVTNLGNRMERISALVLDNKLKIKKLPFRMDNYQKVNSISKSIVSKND